MQASVGHPASPGNAVTRLVAAAVLAGIASIVAIGCMRSPRSSSILLGVPIGFVSAALACSVIPRHSVVLSICGACVCAFAVSVLWLRPESNREVLRNVLGVTDDCATVMAIHRNYAGVDPWYAAIVRVDQHCMQAILRRPDLAEVVGSEGFGSARFQPGIPRWWIEAVDEVERVYVSRDPLRNPYINVGICSHTGRVLIEVFWH